jgi:predicted  nucleic acid-binding Zn-ribbon protein
MATKKDLTVEEKLNQLYTIQLLDSKIDKISSLKGALPMEVSDLEDEISGMEKRIEKLQEVISDFESLISAHNGNIKDSETLIERYQKQLDDVKNNREFEALTKEIEMQNLEMQLSNKKIREIDVKLKEKQETLDEADGKLSSHKETLEIKKVELEKIIVKTEKEETKFMKQSARLKKHVDERLLKSYHRIRSRYKNRLGVASIRRESCGGCFNKIPPQIRIEISSRKHIIACEHCGRVLVDAELAESLTK